MRQKQERLGVACPACGSTASIVQSTRPVRDGRRRRYRVCKRCVARFQTDERVNPSGPFRGRKGNHVLTEPPDDRNLFAFLKEQEVLWTDENRDLPPGNRRRVRALVGIGAELMEDEGRRHLGRRAYDLAMDLWRSLNENEKTGVE